MLVCSVVVRPRRTAAATTVGIIETATAIDANTIGNIVFATLVDAPASVSDRVDAYLGQVMAEQAIISDSYSVGLLHVALLDEPANARDVVLPRGPTVFGVDVAEAATVVDAPSADVPVVSVQRVLCSSRAGLAAVTVDGDGSGKVRVISNVGAVA